ncbi:MAG: hypothetical protein N4A71_03255 [Carboxylicivirga sp.]|jgi:hypothetical protein|nr:hypothetical protein [Carboxylicivirga sp.]
MKKRIRFLLFAGLTTIIFSACEKDDDDGVKEIDPNKMISVHGLEFNLEMGILYRHNNIRVVDRVDYTWYDEYIFENENGDLVNYSDPIDAYASNGITGRSGSYMIALYEEGVKYEPHTERKFGNGAVVCLQMASGNTEKLEPGTYQYAENGAANTFFGYAASNYNFNPLNYNDVSVPIRLSEGIVTVSQSGEKYTIDFDCKTILGSEVKGKYVGHLEYFDDRITGDVNHIEEVSMISAQDTITVNSIWAGNYINKCPDYVVSTPLLITSEGKTMNGNATESLGEIDKRGIDLTLMYDDKTNSIKFVSPVIMRGTFWRGLTYHIDEIRYPCHTKVSNNSSFSAEEFDKLLQDEDFDFSVTEDDASISLDDVVLPKVVLFETGNGIKGALKIKSISEYKEWGKIVSEVQYPDNPEVVFELKTQVAPSLIKVK